MTLHKNIPLSGMHKAYNWEYADAAARVAASGLTSEDVGKFARQLSDDSIWMLLTTVPAWGAVGGSGGVTLATERVHVDATNGADSPSTTGALTDPYQTLTYAAAQQANPTSQSEYAKECLFVLEPGTYTGDVTLPYRAGVSIQGELVTIVGDIVWNQDPDMMYAYPGVPTSLYGRAALKIGSPTSNPILITGDISSQNVNPSVTQEIGDKYFIANRMVLNGSFMNLASGGTTHANEATGPVHTIWDLCQFPTAATVIFAEGESGTLGKNQIYLNARNCYMVSRVCGNIEIDHLNGVGIYKFDNASGRPGGVATTSYDGNIGGSTYSGSLGMVNCVNLGGGAFFDFGISGSNAYTLNDLWMDDHSWGAIEDDTSFTGFTNPQPRSLSRDKWKWGSSRILWLDGTDGLTQSLGTGTASSPFRTMAEVFAWLNAVTEDDYTIMIAPGSYSVSGLTLEQHDRMTFVALGEVELTGTFELEVNGGAGSNCTVSFIGQGQTDNRGRPAFQMDGFAAQNAVASSGEVGVQVFYSGVWIQGAIKALPSGSSYGAPTVNIEARIDRCLVTGTGSTDMTGGTWESAGVENPLYMRVENSMFQHWVSGISFVDFCNCELLSQYMGPEYNPVGGTSGYAGAFAYWDRGWFGVIGVEGVPLTVGEIKFEVPATLPFLARGTMPIDGTSLNYISKMGFNALPWTGFDAAGYRLITDGRVFGASEADSIVLGYRAGEGFPSCTVRNIAIGARALQVITGANGNCIAIGEDALSVDSTGEDNLAAGHDALKANTTGGENVAVGNGALETNIAGNENTAVGAFAGASINANSGTFIGCHAGNTVTGAGNTCVGDYAGSDATSGTNNTLVGNLAGWDIGTGSENTYIGKEAGENSTDRSGCIAIGAGSMPADVGDYRLMIGAGGIPLVSGHLDDKTFGIDIDSRGDGPNATLDVNGSISLHAIELAGTSRTIGDGVGGDKDYAVYANSDTGACAITLPAIASDNVGRIILVKEVGSSVTNGTTITPNAADYIDGNGVGVGITLSSAAQPSDSMRWIMLQAIEGASNDYWYIIGGGVSEQSYNWSGTTADATPAEIYIDGVSSEHVILAAEQTIALTIDVVARKNTTNKSKFWRLDVAAQRDGSNNSALVNTVVKTVLVQSDASGGTDDWDIAVTVNDTDETLVITVTGEAASSIAWAAKASTVIKA